MTETGATGALAEKDLRVDVFRGAGNAVRIVHVPTGLVATAEGSESPLELKERAMADLRQKVTEHGG